jgi:mycothiol synthase
MGDGVNVEHKMKGGLAAGYALRRPEMADAAGVLAVIAANDLVEFGEAQGYGLEDIAHDWQEIDLERDSWLVMAPDGALAAYLYLRDREHVRIDVEIYIHPSHFGKGIGSGLIQLAEARAEEIAALAPPGERVVLNNWINARNADACALLEREGYHPVRYFWRMVVDLEDEPEGVDWPDGFAVRAGVPGEEIRLFYDVVEEAFADHWGHVPIDFEAWRERQMGPTFDPTLWFLATAEEEPAGAALCRITDGMGWIDTIAVRAKWRQRGLGLALVRNAMGELYRREMRRVGLTVDADSPTGATRLYERAGMRADQQYAGYSKALREGDRG